MRELTEELRLTSSFDGPINFMIGGLLQDSRAHDFTEIYFNADAPAFVPGWDIAQDGTAYSVFGQLSWMVVQTLELSAGGRYSYEKKKLTHVRSAVPPFLSNTPPFVDVVPSVSARSWKDFSPELTAAWRPTDQLTVFGSYKRGFLSGGFNVGSVTAGQDLSYGQQKIKGFEGGLKTALLDGRLRMNLTGYSYKVTGLQTAFTVNAVVIVTNAGEVSSRGGEFDFNFRVAPGLNLRGALAYNRGRYEDFITSCYRGQTQAMGCNFGSPNAQGRFTSQDLSGRELTRAPKWNGNIGFSYDGELGSSLKFGLSSDLSYSSSYLTAASSNPIGRQPRYALLDASARVMSADESWEIALIGRNLTDRFYWVRSADAIGGGSVPGGTTGVLADQVASVSRGREVWVRLTASF